MKLGTFGVMSMAPALINAWELAQELHLDIGRETISDPVQFMSSK